MLSKFLTTYKISGEAAPIRGLNSISMRYLKGDFLIDLLPLLPLHLMLNEWIIPDKMFFFIKCIRVFTVIKAFDVQVIYQIAIEYVKKRKLIKMAENPLIADDTSIDHNCVELLLYFKYFLKFFKLIIMISNISYFLGMSWLIFCEIS